MTQDIVERLCRMEPVYNGCAVPCGEEPVNPDGPEAAAEIVALREALRNIVLDCEADYPPSHGAIKQTAKAALASIDKGE